MSGREKSKERNLLQQLEYEASELMKGVETNYYHLLLKYWGISILFVVVGNLVASLLLWAQSNNLIVMPIPRPAYDALIADSTAADIFTASITVNGLLIGFVPLVSFFFIGEMKEAYNEMKPELEKMKGTSSDEAKKLIDRIDNLRYAVLTNLRSGILKFVKTYMSLSIFAEFFLIEFYIVARFSKIPSLFIIVDTDILIVILAGLLPLIAVALYRPSFRLVRYLIVKEELVGLEPKTQ